MGGEGKELLQQEEIDEEFVRCKYFAVGCIEKIHKDEYESHLQEQKEHHMTLLEDTVIEQADIIDHQRQEIQKNPPLFAQFFTKLVWLIESIKTTILLPFTLTEEQQSEWYQKILHVIEPTDKDRKDHGVKGWHMIYISVSMFLLFCYAVRLAFSEPILPAQALPLSIFGIFVSFHWWHSKYLSSFANQIAAVYLVGVWMLLNILLLPVF